MTGTDIAVNAIKVYFKNDKLDADWLNNDIEFYIDNEESLYRAIVDSKRPAHSIAYEALLIAINSRIDGSNLTGKQIQAGFKALGLDFKEIIKPSVEYVEERRQELKEESKEIKTEEEFDEYEDFDACDKVEEASSEEIENIKTKYSSTFNAWKEANPNASDKEIVDIIKAKIYNGELTENSKVEEATKPVKGVLSHIVNVYNLLNSAIDIAEKQNDDTCKEIAGYLYTAMDNIADIDAEGGLGLQLESKDYKPVLEEGKYILRRKTKVGFDYICDEAATSFNKDDAAEFDTEKDAYDYLMSYKSKVVDLDADNFDIVEENKKLNEKFFNLYKSYDSQFSISKYTPSELIKFLDDLKAANRISDKDYKLLIDFANKYQSLIDACGYESEYTESKEVKTEENDLSKDLYGKEANDRTNNKLQRLDISLCKLSDAKKDNDDAAIKDNYTKILNDIGYLIPALNIKGGSNGLVEYIKSTKFNFENKFSDNIELLNTIAKDYAKLYESKEIKTELYDPIESKLPDLARDIQEFMYNFDPYDYNDNYMNDEEAFEDIMETLISEQGIQVVKDRLNEIAEEDNQEIVKQDAKNLLVRIDEFSKELNTYNEGKKIEEADDDFLTDREKEIFNDLKNQKEEVTLYDEIAKRIGQKMTVGEFNTSMQALFAKYNTTWLTRSDLYDKDIDEQQTVSIEDDNDIYIITYNIIDLDDSIIEITDVDILE